MESEGCGEEGGMIPGYTSKSALELSHRTQHNPPREPENHVQQDEITYPPLLKEFTLEKDRQGCCLGKSPGNFHQCLAGNVGIGEEERCTVSVFLISLL